MEKWAETSAQAKTTPMPAPGPEIQGRFRKKEAPGKQAAGLTAASLWEAGILTHAKDEDIR